MIESVSEGFPTYKHGVIKVVSLVKAVKSYGGASFRHNQSPDQSCTLRQGIHTLPLQ